MRLYRTYVPPWLLHLSMRRQGSDAAARGRVLVIAGKGGLGGEIHESLDPQAT